MVCAVGVYAQTTKWRDIYKVKKKDTIFGIANKYGISMPELMDANPEMKVSGYVLKKGDTLFIPFAKGTQPSAVAQGSTLTTKAQKKAASKAIDGDGRRMVEYYRGMLMACDDLKRQGISTNIHAWNVPIDADIRQALLQNGANECDIIFGPLYTKQVDALAEFCKNYEIKMVIPFSIEGNAVDRNKQVFQVYQSPMDLNEDAIKAFLNRFPNAHPVFIDCADNTSQKGTFTMGLRTMLEKKNISYNLTSLKSPEESFAKAFDRTKQNVVILNSARSPQLTEALNKLDAMTSKYPGSGSCIQAITWTGSSNTTPISPPHSITTAALPRPSSWRTAIVPGSMGLCSKPCPALPSQDMTTHNISYRAYISMERTSWANVHKTAIAPCRRNCISRRAEREATATRTSN